MAESRRIAYWLTEKKSLKINWEELRSISAKYGFELFKLDLSKNLSSQGPFSVFLHKLTDIIALAEQGDDKSLRITEALENYISSHPNLIVIDPIDKVRQLLNRYNSYSIILQTDLHKHGIFTPNFCEITTDNTSAISKQLSAASINYPFMCKPMLGHGSKQAHEMIIIFNENGLKDCKAPCVAQSFINHNAILFKIFVLGERYYYVERPSLKNFYASDCESISFRSSVVSKAGAHCYLTILEPDEEACKIVPENGILEKIAVTLRKAFGMDLIGIDVIVENGTGRYGIIDINAFPGYDGFPNYYDSLFHCINSKVSKQTDVDIIDKPCDSFKMRKNIDNDPIKTSI